MLSNIWVWDPASGIREPGSGIRKKPISDPGSRGQKGTGSRIRIRNTGVSYHNTHLRVREHLSSTCSTVYGKRKDTLRSVLYVLY
jgi:hypothetical protein